MEQELGGHGVWSRSGKGMWNEGGIRNGRGREMKQRWKGNGNKAVMEKECGMKQEWGKKRI